MLESLFSKVTGLQACNFTKKKLQHRRFPVNIANFKNTYFEKDRRRAAFDSSYILHRKLNKIIQEPDKITLFYLLSFVFIRFITRCHLLSLIVVVSLLLVILCHLLHHSLSLFATRWTTRCHSLYHSLSFAIICCHSL